MDGDKDTFRVLNDKLRQARDETEGLRAGIRQTVADVRANKTTAENGIKRLEDLAGKRPATGGAS